MLAGYDDPDTPRGRDMEPMHTMADSPTMGAEDDNSRARRIDQLMIQNHLSYASVATLPLYRAQNSPRVFAFDQSSSNNVMPRTS